MDKNDKNSFEIIEGTNQFIKIPIHGKVPPVRLHFEYPEGSTKKNDLTVCLSRRHKQPQLSNSEKIFYRPAQAILESVDPFYL